MRLTFFLVWKSWASSPFRVLLTWLGIALGVAVVTAIHVLDHNTILSELLRKRGDFGRVDYELVPLSSERSLAQQLAALRGRSDLERVGLFAETQVRVALEGEELEQVPLFGIEAAAEFGHYVVEQGRRLDELDGEHIVLVSRPLLERLGKQLGDRIELRELPRADQVVCVRGKRVAVEGGEQHEPLRVEAEIGGVLGQHGIGQRNAGLVLVGRFALARRLGVALQPRLQVVRTPGVDPDALMLALREHYLVQDERSALIGEGADERAFRNGVKVLGCLALVLGMFVIFHTLSHSLAERVRTIGLLRCLGATPRQVSAVFVTDAVLLSLLGTLAGLLLGALLALILGGMEVTTLGIGKAVDTFEIPWGALVPIAALGVAFTWLGAAFPLLKVRQLEPRRILYVRDLAPPADLLRGVHLFLFVILVFFLPLAYLAMTPLLDPSGSGAGIVLLEAVGIVALFFAVLLLSPRLVRVVGGLPLRLLGRAWPLQRFLLRKRLVHAPGKLATSVCGLSLVALAALGHQSLTLALQGEVRQFARVGLDDKLFLKFGEGIRAEQLAELRADPGVASVLPLEARVALPFLTVGTDSAELGAAGGPFADQPELLRAMRERRGLVISDRLARLRELEPGSRIGVRLDREVVEYEVLAISDREGFFPDERAFALVDRSWLETDFCLDTSWATRISVRLREGADAASVVELAGSFPQKLGWARPGAEVEAFHVHDVSRDFVFFDVLLGLLFALAGLGQLNLITLQAIAREREVGILRAFGATRGDFVKLLLLEAAVVGFLAGLLALATGIPLSWVLVEGLSQVSGLDTPWAIPWIPALSVAAVAFAVSMLAALIPAWRSTGFEPGRAVRSTE
jgi:putative ABC transport system permease protein